MNASAPELLLASEDIRRVAIVECGEPLEDIKRIEEISYGPPPECPETTPDYTWVRLGVLERLLKAQSLLPHGLKIRLYEGFRSLKVQALLFAQEHERVLKRNRNLSREEAFHETTRLVSPTEMLDGSPNIPPHNTGGAVDVEIVEANGHVIDFGMEIRQWVSVPPALCRTFPAELAASARANRQLLLKAMEDAGFVNYTEEWWHFSYGDRYWALKTGQKAAIYGRVLDVKQVLPTA